MKYLKIMFFVLMSQINFGQTTVSNGSTITNYIERLDVKSPNVADFIKYGNINSVNNIGELKLNIPIFSAPISNSNKIDLSLSYFGSGFRPTKRSGLVGYNWVLNVGGVISRDVNGVPDDQRGHSSSAQSDLNYANGYIIGARTKPNFESSVFNFSNTVFYEDSMGPHLYANNNSNAYDTSNYETDPDIFNFNFNGITGKFLMGNDGLIKVINSSPNNLKIDITELAFQDDYSFISKPKPSKITITDDSGNKYFFGGELKNLEYSLSTSASGGTGNPVINSWFMYKIEYYNGFVLNFNYKDDSLLNDSFGDAQVAIHNMFGLLSNPNELSNFVVLNESYSLDESETNNSNFTLARSSSNNSAYSLQKIAILENITCNNFKITFDYSRQPHPFNTRNSTTDIFPNQINISPYSRFFDLKIDRIKLFDAKNIEIKNVQLIYDHFGGITNSRMFLKSVTEVGMPGYSFEYFPTGILPKPITNGIDHWGYWNGNDSNTNRLIPLHIWNNITSDYTLENSVGGRSRNPNFEFALKGQLKQVIYPTKGISEFEYEPHTYSKRLELRSNNSFEPALYDINDIAGGTRIKKIIDYSEGNVTNIKEYKYNSNYSTNGTVSSGILLKWPRYNSTYKKADLGGYYEETFFSFRRSNSVGNPIIDGAILNYSEVTLVTNGNGFNVSKYSDYLTNPDSFDNNILSVAHTPGICVPMGLAMSYIGNLLNDRSSERGKIIEERTYDVANNLKSLTSLIYNNNPGKFFSYVSRIHWSGPITIANKIYTYNDFLTEKTSTTFLPTGNIVTTEKSEYGFAPTYFTSTTAQHVLTKQTLTSSINNLTNETQYKYPWDIYGVPNATFDLFKAANISLPLSVSQFKSSVKLSENFTAFANDVTTNNRLLPKFIYTGKFPNSNPTIPVIGQLEKNVSFDLYDDKSNLIQFTKESGSTTAIIWGYNKTQPVAKIENATYAQVSSLVANLQTLSETGTETNLISALNNLRVTPSLSNCMISTYTHKPLIGVSTMTDTKGYTMYYNYDSLGRLQNVKDKDGNVISENQYHFKN